MFGGVPTLVESDNGQIPRALGIVIQESRQCNGHSVPANTQYYHVQQIYMELKHLMKLTVLRLLNRLRYGISAELSRL